MIAVIPKPDDLYMIDAFKLPFFDFEKFPYIMFRDYDGKFHLLNLQEKSIQLLVKESCASGFCIQTGNRAFDLHLTSGALEEDKKNYNYHHRLLFFEDAIAAMEEGHLTITVVKEKKEALDLIK